MKDICIELEIMQDPSARNKCANIVEHVITKRENCAIENSQNKEFVEYLRTCRFSILIDEIIYGSDAKIMCILVRYVLPLNKKKFQLNY